MNDQMEDKQTIQQYDDFYKIAAKHHMVVNCHGCNKPTGERRKYPNVINREAIRGNEMHNVYGDPANRELLQSLDSLMEKVLSQYGDTDPCEQEPVLFKGDRRYMKRK